MALVNFESINAQMAAHQNTWMVGVGMVVIFGLLNAIGVEIFGKVEVVLTFGMWTTLDVYKRQRLPSTPPCWRAKWS